ncbi:MAG: apolipoprotein N-acyltransferase, partial [Pseudomonadota bacterium]
MAAARPVPGERSGAPAQWLLALLAGIAHTASFAPLEAWPLQILSLAGLAALARSAGPRAAAALGWWFAFGWLASGMWWLYISMHRYGGMPAPLAVLAVLLLAAALALYYALALGAWARWRGAGSRPARSA